MAKKSQRRKAKASTQKQSGAEEKPWAVEEISENVHVIRYKFRSGFEEYVLLASDIHYDNPHCNRKLFKKHLDEARERNAPIIMPGDVLCLMQGKYDPRKTQSGLRKEHRVEDYLDAVIETTAKDFDPYKDLIALMGEGNHETSVRTRQGVDMIKRLARELGTFKGGYRGWVRFIFEHEGGGHRQSKTMWYTHGSGGGGPVTKGVIKSNRAAAMVDGADIIVRGHIHEAWTLDAPKFALSSSHNPYHKSVLHIQCPTYKDEIESGASGWANEKGFPPKPLGGWWLKFTSQSNIVRVTAERAD